MTQFDSDADAPRPDGKGNRADRGGSVGLLLTVALLAVALGIGLFLYGAAQKQAASSKNAAPSLTTGAATSKPNTEGVTPPASR